MTASTATANNVNTSVQKVKTLVETATTAIDSARGNGNGNPLMLVGTTINVRMSLSDKLYRMLTNFYLECYDRRKQGAQRQQRQGQRDCCH